MIDHSQKCPSCGAEIRENDQLCAKCGHIVTRDPSTIVPPPIPIPPLPGSIPAKNVPPPIPNIQIPPTPPASQERAICVVGKVSLKTGVFSSDLYHMVITEKRLIFARQTKEMQTADAQRAREKAKQQGKNLLGQIGAQISTGSGEKYLVMAPDLILSENPQNFAIPLDEVIRINTYHAGFDDNSPDTMEVITPLGNWKFQIANYYKVQQQLKEVLGSKVR